MTPTTRQFTIGAVEYDGDRILDADWLGYIELRRPGGTEPLARINYHGPGTPMDLCTYGQPLPLPAVEWLIEKGWEKLA